MKKGVGAKGPKVCDAKTVAARIPVPRAAGRGSPVRRETVRAGPGKNSRLQVGYGADGPVGAVSAVWSGSSTVRRGPLNVFLALTIHHTPTTMNTKPTASGA